MKHFNDTLIKTLESKGFERNPYTGNYELDKQPDPYGVIKSYSVAYLEEYGYFCLQTLRNYEFESDMCYPSCDSLLNALSKL